MISHVNTRRGNNPISKLLIATDLAFWMGGFDVYGVRTVR